MSITLPLLNYRVPARVELKPARSGHTLVYIRRAGDAPCTERFFIFKPFETWARLSDEEYLQLATFLRVSVWELREAVKATCFEP